MFKKIFVLMSILLLLNPVSALEESRYHALTVFKEKMILLFTFDESEKARKMLEFANDRMKRISTDVNSTEYPQLLGEYQDYIESADMIAERRNDSDLKEEVASERLRNIATLERVYDKVPEDAKYRIEIVLDRNVDDIAEANKTPLASGEKMDDVNEIIKKRDLPRVEIGSIDRQISPAKRDVAPVIRESNRPDVPVDNADSDNGPSVGKMVPVGDGKALPTV